MSLLMLLLMLLLGFFRRGAEAEVLLIDIADIDLT